jgi:uncharacterized protein (TIGR00251 family)
MSSRGRNAPSSRDHTAIFEDPVAAPPADGAANDELVRFLAELFGLPKRNVAVVGGHTSRRKTVEVLGIEEEEAARRLGI